jgi:hypothetical protein
LIFLADEKRGDFTLKMNIIFSALLFFSFSVHAGTEVIELPENGGISCDNNLPFKFSTDNLFQTKCDLSKVEKRDNLRQNRILCDCLKSEAKANVFIQSRLDDGQVTRDRIDKSKQEYQKRFVDVYGKMTLGASIQSEILNLNNEESVDGTSDKKVGCTASEFSGLMSEKIEANIKIQSDALSSLLNEAQEKFAKCKKNKSEADCLNQKNVINQIIQNQRELKEKSPCSVSLNLLKTQLNSDHSLDDMKRYFSKDKKTLDQINLIEGVLKSGKVMSLAFYAGAPVPLSFNSCETIKKFVAGPYQKFNESQIEGADILARRSSQCDAGDLLCNLMEQQNQNLQNKIKERYRPTKDCITQAEFDTYKGMPGEELLGLFADTRRKPGSILKIPHSTESIVDKQRIDFLRSNPIIAKMATDDKMRAELGQKLHSLALEMKGKSPAEKFKKYISFMKDDVKKLLKDKEMKSVNEYVCHSLVDNLTAIELANDIPPIDKKEKHDGDIGMLFHHLDRCHVDDFNQSATTNLNKTLETSPIFTLGLTSGEVKDEKKEFDDLKAQVCGEYNETFAKKNCHSVLDEKCRNKFLKNTKNAVAGAISDTPGAINSFLNEKQISHAMADTDRNQQDNDFKSWYKENVASKFDPNVLASRGYEDNFVKSQEQNRSISSTTEVPERFSNTSSNVTTPSVATSTNPAIGSSSQANSPGQQVPDYAQQTSPTFDPTKLSNATGPKDLIPNFNQLPLTDQKQSLSDVKDFIASQDNPPFDPEVVDEEINKVDDKIAAIKKSSITPDNQDVRSGSIVNPAAAATFTNPGQVNPALSGSIGPSISNQSNFASNRNSNFGKNVKPSVNGAKSMNEALLNANESRENPESISSGSRSPASVNGTEIFNFQKGVLDPSLVDQALLVQEQVLVPETHEKYEKIKSNLDDLKKYLAEKVDPSQFKESKVFKIKDPNKSPDAYILFYVSKGQSGSINVKTIDRKKTLKSLNNSFK